MGNNDIQLYVYMLLFDYNILCACTVHILAHFEYTYMQLYTFRHFQYKGARCRGVYTCSCVTAHFPYAKAIIQENSNTIISISQLCRLNLTSATKYMYVHLHFDMV